MGASKSAYFLCLLVINEIPLSFADSGMYDESTGGYRMPRKRKMLVPLTTRINTAVLNIFDRSFHLYSSDPFFGWSEKTDDAKAVLSGYQGKLTDTLQADIKMHYAHLKAVVQYSTSITEMLALMQVKFLAALQSLNFMNCYILNKYVFNDPERADFCEQIALHLHWFGNARFLALRDRILKGVKRYYTNSALNIALDGMLHLLNLTLYWRSPNYILRQMLQIEDGKSKITLEPNTSEAAALYTSLWGKQFGTVVPFLSVIRNFFRHIAIGSPLDESITQNDFMPSYEENLEVWNQATAFLKKIRETDPTDFKVNYKTKEYDRYRSNVSDILRSIEARMLAAELKTPLDEIEHNIRVSCSSLSLSIWFLPPKTPRGTDIRYLDRRRLQLLLEGLLNGRSQTAVENTQEADVWTGSNVSKSRSQFSVASYKDKSRFSREFTKDSRNRSLELTMENFKDRMKKFRFSIKSAQDSSASVADSFRTAQSTELEA